MYSIFLVLSFGPAGQVQRLTRSDHVGVRARSAPVELGSVVLFISVVVIYFM